jgi:hypothetical protein
MRHTMAMALVLSCLAGPASADPCDDLISSVEGALGLGTQSPEMRSQLESLLEAGRSAKSRGDVAACQAAISGSLQSPAPGGAGGQECESTKEKTV